MIGLILAAMMLAPQATPIPPATTLVCAPSPIGNTGGSILFSCTVTMPPPPPPITCAAPWTIVSGVCQPASAPPVIVPPTVSPNCTVGAAIVDSDFNVWAIPGGIVMENGKAAGYSNGVIALAYANKSVYQENAAKLWWMWTPSASYPWTAVADPTINSCIPPVVVVPPPPVAHNVSLTWTAPTGAVKGYNVYRSSAGGIFTLMNMVPVTTTSYLDAVVSNGESYTYQVTAVSPTGANSIASNQFTIAIP
jgi:hypothetical protein